MKDFCVIGSGIAGSTVTNLLSKKYSIEIFDKARGPGGRASNRRYKNNLSFDHGLQYLSHESNEFKKIILDLKKKKIVKEWPGYHLDFTFEKKINSIKYIGSKGNSDFCKYFIKNVKSNYLANVTNIKFNSNYWTITLNNKDKIFFKNLVLTCPFPQLKKLMTKSLRKKISKFQVKMVPNITMMAAYKKNGNIQVSSIKFNDKIIAWASHENSKNRFKSIKSLWTLQCSVKFSKENINLLKKNKKKYQLVILKRFEKLTGFKANNVIFQSIHGWKYAYNKKNSNRNCLWLNKYNLGVCADWFNGPKAEDAWNSAKSLYSEIKKNPPKNRRV